jgi:hypothetical protein
MTKSAGQPTVREAVKCSKWQEFRKTLLRQPTVVKLEKLTPYAQPQSWNNKTDEIRRYMVNEDGTFCCNLLVRQVQTLNYVNALARGGMIERVPKEWATLNLIGRWLREKRYREVDRSPRDPFGG